MDRRWLRCKREPSGIVASNVTEDLHRNPKDMGVLFSVRKQLVQIEKQPYNLMDLLQIHWELLKRNGVSGKHECMVFESIERKQRQVNRSRFSTSSAAPTTAVHYRTDKSSNGEILNHPFWGSGGFIVNPLAEIHGQSRGDSDAANH